MRIYKKALPVIVGAEDRQIAEWLATHPVTRGPIRYAIESEHAAADPAGERQNDSSDDATAETESPTKRRRRSRGAGQAVYETARKKREKQTIEANSETETTNPTVEMMNE
jgi:hypothetical protein